MVLENLLRKAYLQTLTPSEQEAFQIPQEENREIVMDQVPEVDEDDITEEEIDAIVNSFNTFDDIADAYDPEDLAIIDWDSGELISDINESMMITEVLSRAERIKARIRMTRTKVRRQAKLRIALKRKANNTVLKKRARRLAIKAMKTKLAKKPMGKLSIGEKERLERIIAKRRKMVDRVTVKLMPRVRKIEQERLSHKSFTK